MMMRLFEIAAERKEAIEKAAFLAPLKAVGGKAMKVLGAAFTANEVATAAKKGANLGRKPGLSTQTTNITM